MDAFVTEDRANYFSKGALVGRQMVPSLMPIDLDDIEANITDSQRDIVCPCNKILVVDDQSFNLFTLELLMKRKF